MGPWRGSTGFAGASVALAALGALAAGCGGGDRRDAGGPSGAFRVEVVHASFPARQTLAQGAALRIRVRNADRRTVPDVAVTVRTRAATAGAAPVAFGLREQDARLADTARPVWILDAGPSGGDAAQTDTWALGPLRAGEERTFIWRLTAVKAGSYTVDYRVAPDLTGRATAAGSARTRGALRVTIADEPVPATVDANGDVVRGGGETP